MVIRLNRVDLVDHTHSHSMASPSRESPEQIPIMRAPVSTVESVANSALFRLPRELRDQIYKIALELSQPLGYITVSSNGIPEPCLLTTCRTIRQEAIELHYTTSEFTMEIPSYDPTALVLWHRKWMILRQQYDVQENLREKRQVYMLYTGREKWKHLMLWLQCAHSAMCGAPSELDVEHPAEKQLIYALFGMVRAMQERPWEDVELLLRSFHPVLVSLNRKWK